MAYNNNFKWAGKTETGVVGQSVPAHVYEFYKTHLQKDKPRLHRMILTSLAAAARTGPRQNYDFAVMSTSLSLTSVHNSNDDNKVY